MSAFSDKLKKKPNKSLYISRQVENANEIIAWAATQGFKTTLKPSEMHVTVACSSKPVDWKKIPDAEDKVEIKGGDRSVSPLGDKGAIVLKFDSSELQSRFKELTDLGASWDWDSYHPHVSITYAGAGVDTDNVSPFKGNLILGPEVRREVIDEWAGEVEEISPHDFAGKRKFFVMSTFGETLDLAIQLQEEKEEVVLYVPDHDYSAIGKNIVPKADNWHEYVGKGYIWVIDGCENASLQDWLRSKGESVVGTNSALAEYENDRQLGQDFFKECGFNQPESNNFTDFDSAIDFIRENSDSRWILKQNGDAPKHLNHMGKFDEGVDMLYHLEELKKTWQVHEWGPIDFDLMEIVEGVEMAASAFFNGHDWIRNSEGKAIGYLNGEEKKSDDGGLGETCGETGTTFIGVTEDDEVFADILLRPEITALLKKHDYRGVFDINGSLTDNGYVAFEATSRFGIPGTSYEFIEGLKSKTGDLLEAMAKGLDTPIDIHEGHGMVMVVSGKPFPLETSTIDNDATSIGKKLWILEDGEPVDELSKEQKKHIHLENFHKDDEGHYRVASKNGYLLTVTGRGKSIEKTREDLISYIKDNLYIEGMKYRLDIGKRLEDEF